MIDRHRIGRERAVGQRRDPHRPVLARQRRQHAATVVIEREGDVGARHRQPLHDIDRGGELGARRVRRNLRRAGTRANRSSTTTRVPGGTAAGPSRTTAPLSTTRPQPSPPATRLSIVSRATLAIEGKASPRKPSVATASIARLDCRAAWRWHGVRARARSPPPSSRSRRPPPRSGRAPPPPAITAMRDRARVDRVFDQFLQRAGGSFDHFTGSDAIDQMLGQAPY